MNYEAYLRSNEWRRKRRDRLRLDQNRCSACEGTTGLQVHHLSYAHFGDEPLTDLVTLCEDCHGLVHELVRQGRARIDSPLDGLFDKDRAEATRLSNPVVARYREQKVGAARQRIVTAGQARARLERIRARRLETPEQRDRASDVAARLGFELPAA